ncbi:hypothetical protein NBZ79_00590 [Sneathiella marina]|uniref:Uncharacterized protein n=1 Tax=Sneathiella marina TaxID=2950108 RepID=A0ABY4W6D0_9PROT|nr:hypothetical protein [Sneathiella marina]USG61472.1 hypothetical protein NBZ79_00590 [Sneathiella marina]
MTDPFPHCIRAIVQREDTPEAAVSRIQAVFPYWSLKAIHSGAEADIGDCSDKAYRLKLNSLIEVTAYEDAERDAQ